MQRRVVSRRFEVWRDRDALESVLRAVVADAARGRVEAVALTTTAELSDAFRTKREGVGFVLDAAEAALRGRRLLALTTDGELVSFAEARARPLAVAAANWVASALAVAELHPDALMIDVGSTTVDLIPIVAGRVAAVGRTDLDRLLAGELVYTGALRTNLAAIAPSVPVRDRWCPVASELFAISADVHLILGHLTPDGYTCATPDGRPATIDWARERVARLVCADVEQLAAGGDRCDRRLPARGAAPPDRGGGAPGQRARGRRAAGGPPGRRGVPGARSGAAPGSGRGRAAMERRRARRGTRRRARRAAGRTRAVTTVVKIGGGLAREAGDTALRELCRAVGEAGARHPLLVVPGGAGFADAVRAHEGRFALREATVHRMAILAMDQFGWLLSDLIPDALPCTQLASARDAAGRGQTPVLLAAAMLASDPLPVSAAVTSDSIAAWLAGVVGAARVVLVKPVAGLYRDWPPDGPPPARLSVGELAGLRAAGRAAGVDAYLPQALRAADVEAWVIDGRDPARLVTLLERGSAAGTLVT